MKIVCYTAIVGGYDNLPLIQNWNKDIDYVCFSDDPAGLGDHGRWRMVKVDRYFEDDKITSGFLKSRPDVLFGHDSVTIWMDANHNHVKLDINAFLGGGNTMVLRHPVRQSVLDEARAVVKSKLDNAARVESLLFHMKEQGFRDDVGLSDTSFLKRDNRDDKVRQANRLWWECMCKGVRRDQVSFDFAFWRAGASLIHLDFYNFPVELDLTKGPHKNPVKRSNGAGASGPKFHPLQLNMPKMPERYPLGICYQSESGSALENELHRAINKTVAAAIGVRLEGNYCHFHHSEVSEFTPTDPRRSWKREYLRHAVKDRRRALEVGFNAGHSAALMLAVNPLLSVHAIDICRHAYTEPCAALLGKKFGTRFGFGKGDSKSVLAQLDLKQFDFVHIGGGHDARTAKSDVDLFCARATVGTLLLVDDAYVPNISSMLHEKFTAGQLVPTVRGFPSSGENLLFVKTG